ncbi:4299_t:CDS:2 [Entrophospora sp. SA101]|nr:4299_t:CDS:2 [Entrophospora sp. SA101]
MAQKVRQLIIKTRYPEGQKSSNEQKKRTVNDEPTEESVLFDESNEGVLISSIDESGLKGETTLPASKKIIDQEFLQRIQELSRKNSQDMSNYNIIKLLVFKFACNLIG